MQIMIEVSDDFMWSLNNQNRLGKLSNEGKAILNGTIFASKQDIIKPYFEQLKQAMKERDEDNGGEPLNAVDRGYHLAYEHLCEEIDELLSEVKKKE